MRSWTAFDQPLNGCPCGQLPCRHRVSIVADRPEQSWGLGPVDSLAARAGRLEINGDPLSIGCLTVRVARGGYCPNMFNENGSDAAVANRLNGRPACRRVMADDDECFHPLRSWTECATYFGDVIAVSAA